MRLMHLTIGLILCVALPLSAQTINRQRDPGDRADSIARSQQAAARSQMEAARLKVVSAFEASPEWTAAQTDLKQLQTAHDEAAKPVLAALKEKPEYQKAVAAQEAARADVATHQEKPQATPEQLTAPATAALEASSEVTKLEQDALAADPKVTELKAKLTEATARIQQLTAQRDAAVLADADWQAAKRQHDEAVVNAAQSH